MALQKSKTLPNGVVGNYWKITSLVVDRIRMIATYEIELFLGSGISASLGEKKTFRFSVTSQELGCDLAELGYTKIKAEASRVVRPAVAEVQAVAEELDNEGNVVVPAVAYVAPVQAKYGDEDLNDAADV